MINTELKKAVESFNEKHAGKASIKIIEHFDKKIDLQLYEAFDKVEEQMHQLSEAALSSDEAISDVQSTFCYDDVVLDSKNMAIRLLNAELMK